MAVLVVGVGVGLGVDEVGRKTTVETFLNYSASLHRTSAAALRYASRVTVWVKVVVKGEEEEVSRLTMSISCTSSYKRGGLSIAIAAVSPLHAVGGPSLCAVKAAAAVAVAVAAVVTAAVAAAVVVVGAAVAVGVAQRRSLCV